MNYKLEIREDGLFIGGKPFYLASGDMHYFRFFKGGWKRRLQLMKDFGLTALQTYVPWNLHEPERGEFNFEDNLDLAAFLKMCDETGLKVILRPSVYMCSEWDFGGMPHWLQAIPNMCVRSCDEAFLECAKSYYTRLAKEFIPYLSTNGGPIIAVAAENEYGSFGSEREYISWTIDLMKELGVDVPMISSNAIDCFKIHNGSSKELWNAINVHNVEEEKVKHMLAYQPDKPLYVAEFWGGRGIQQGGYFARQKPETVAKNYKDIIEYGAYANFYMFCGGTNYGFMNGALVGKYNCGVAEMGNIYIPFATSYDVDAPVTEYGEPTKKYFMCKQVLREYMEKHGFEFGGSDETELTNKVPTQKIGDVTLTQSADVLSQADSLCTKKCRSGNTLTMDAMGQDYGFILYTTNINYTDDTRRMLIIEGLHDRAMVYGNGEFLGVYMRDRDNEPITFAIPEHGMKLEILVENMGRVNYGNKIILDKKGICDMVRIELLDDEGNILPYNYSMRTGWENRSLPMKNPEQAVYDNGAQKCRPALFKGAFKAVPGVDTFIDMKNLHKGNVWINGFNIGRYWEIGPQETLYIPGELLREENTIHVLELHNTENVCKVSFSDTPKLDGIDKDEFFSRHSASGKCEQNN